MPTRTKEKSLAKVNKDIMACPVCNSAGQGLLVPGEGPADADIVFVGEAPGKQEVVTGRPFIGRAGKLLRALLAGAGLDEADAFITSAVKYLPKNYVTPKPKDIEHGRIHLFSQLETISPKVIVLLGNVAAEAVLHEKFAIAKNHGTFLKRGPLTYFLSYHPAAPLYDPKLRPVIEKDFKKLKRKI